MLYNKLTVNFGGKIMSVTKTFYGKTKDGKTVDKYIIKNKSGTSAEIITYGGTLDRLFIRDRGGKLEDVLIGFDSLEGHENLSANQGVLVGRYANRIAGGRFSLDGENFEVTHNENETCLHGGDEFSKAVWDGEILNDNSLKLSYFSPDMSCGFPGSLKVSVIYTLTEKDELRLDFSGISDRKTIMNFTNHAYFNLGGFDSGDICGHELFVDADYFTPTDENSIPTGEKRKVEGTPFDFRRMKAIGRDMGENYDQLINARGYDHNFCINSPSLSKPCAVVKEPVSGRKMEVFTDLPGVQLYCGNFLDNVPGKAIMNKYYGFCLETQFWPDTPNQPDFPSCVFDKDEEFKTTTIFKFSTK